jgi:hypothetical protein
MFNTSYSGKELGCLHSAHFFQANRGAFKRLDRIRIDRFIAGVLLLGKPFHLQPSLMFVGKARSLPNSGAPERYFIRVGSALPTNITISTKRITIILGLE